MFRLSGETNAHAELYDQKNYIGTGVDINFEDIFEFKATWNRDCKNNPIFRLSSETNAHAKNM
jgi:hypothetical protein